MPYFGELEQPRMFRDFPSDQVKKHFAAVFLHELPRQALKRAQIHDGACPRPYVIAVVAPVSALVDHVCEHHHPAGIVPEILAVYPDRLRRRTHTRPP